MNADLYTLLLFLSVGGIFLAVVVGRMQLSQEDELERQVKEKLKAYNELEDDYRELSRMAESLGVSGERDILPIVRRSGSYDIMTNGHGSLGETLRKALILYEAIEHVDDPLHADAKTVEAMTEAGVYRASDAESQLEDMKSLLRLAREIIHARHESLSRDEFQKRVAALIAGSGEWLSDNGLLRLRELIAILHQHEFEKLTDEYKDYLHVVEELVLK